MSDILSYMKAFDKDGELSSLSMEFGVEKCAVCGNHPYSLVNFNVIPLVGYTMQQSMFCNDCADVQNGFKYHTFDLGTVVSSPFAHYLDDYSTLKNIMYDVDKGMQATAAGVWEELKIKWDAENAEL